MSMFDLYYAWYKLWFDTLFEVKALRNCRDIDVKRLDDHERRLHTFGI